MCCSRLAANSGRKKLAKSRHLGTIAQLCRAISSQLLHVSTIGKNLLSSNIPSRYPHNMVNFGLLAAEIVSLVWGTPANFNAFRVLAALLHGTLASTKLRRSTEGATYIRQGGHHVGHWPTFLVLSFLMVDLCIRADHYILPCSFVLSSFFFPHLISAVADLMCAILPHMDWP